MNLTDKIIDEGLIILLVYFELSQCEMRILVSSSYVLLSQLLSLSFVVEIAEPWSANNCADRPQTLLQLCYFVLQLLLFLLAYLHLLN